MKLPLSTAFTESHQFWVVVFSFSFIPMHIFISFLISSVICWLFRSVLFSFHVFVFLTACFPGLPGEASSSELSRAWSGLWPSLPPAEAAGKGDKDGGRSSWWPRGSMGLSGVHKQFADCN